MPFYEVFRDKGGEWRWRLVADNHEIVAQSESYPSKAHALRAAQTAGAVSLDAEEEVHVDE